MKKIGLFTIYIANYGAVLQTYALQRFLRDKYDDLKVEVVDFYSHTPYSIFKKASQNPIKNILKQSTRLLHYTELSSRNKRERLFISEEFILSRRYDSLEDLLDNMPQYDIYLTGSDQVFNTNSPYSPLFYQRFKINNGLKAAYAPSFGTSDFSDDYKRSILAPIKGFNFLSCREDDGAEMMSELLGHHVPRVIDPTLLLTKDQWATMMKAPVTSEDYLLVYDLNGGQKMINYAIYIAKEHGWKIWCISQHTELRYKGIDKIIFDAGPREFVGLFANAQYVVTDSFHGTSFSIIFEKLFKTYIAVPRASRRIVSLLKECGMESRIISKDSDFNSFLSDKTVSADLTSFKLLRSDSIKYIDDIVTA